MTFKPTKKKKDKKNEEPTTLRLTRAPKTFKPTKKKTSRAILDKQTKAQQSLLSAGLIDM